MKFAYGERLMPLHLIDDEFVSMQKLREEMVGSKPNVLKRLVPQCGLKESLCQIAASQ